MKKRTIENLKSEIETAEKYLELILTHYTNIDPAIPKKITIAVKGIQPIEFDNVENFNHLVTESIKSIESDIDKLNKLLKYVEQEF